MKKRSERNAASIYRNQSISLRTIFDEAKSLRHILCVALDFAKAKHVALICDGKGDVLKSPFPVHNSPEGVAFLCEQIEATARRRKIPKKHVFVGGEDGASYVENFTAALCDRGRLVVRVNAREAKENREDTLASTDNLDLIGIAKTMLSRRARVARDPRESEPAIYHELRSLCRSRRKLIRDETAASNRIHAQVDRLFPGFLDPSKSGLTPFGRASLHLMGERFSAPEIARRAPASLTRTLRSLQVHHPEETAGKLLALARGALPPAPSRIAAQQRSLATSVELYRCLENAAIDLRAEAAGLLASTPYAFLTSLPGIGFVLAAGVAGEFGDPDKLAPLDSMCAYAGIVPATYQSGGPDSPPRMGGTSARCNHILEDWVVQSPQKLRQYGPSDWKERFVRWEAGDQHALFAGARRYLRVLRTLVRRQIPYEMPEARLRDATPEQRAASAAATWDALLKKWRTIPGWQELAFGQGKPLAFWRELANAVHGTNLSLPKER